MGVGQRSISNASLYSDSNPSRTSTEDDLTVMDEINKGKWRHRHVRKHFEELPENEICIADFTCALMQKGLLRQGRLYFTQEYCCFHSPIANTKVIIHVSEILQVNPRNTLVFPTALDVDTKDGKSFAFKSFLFRGNALNSFSTILLAWKRKSSSSGLVGNSSDLMSSEQIPRPTLGFKSESNHSNGNLSKRDAQVLRILTLSMLIFVGMNVFMLLKSSSIAYL